MSSGIQTEKELLSEEKYNIGLSLAIGVHFVQKRGNNFAFSLSLYQLQGSSKGFGCCLNMGENEKN
jgi:hypothetical protein